MAATKDSPEENAQHFAEIAKTAKQLIDNGMIIVQVSLPGKIKFAYEIDQIKPTLDLNKIDVEAFRSALDFDIPQMASAILQRRKSAFASLLIHSAKQASEGKPFDEEHENRLIEEKYNLVEKEIITSSIRRQVAIKNSSKINVFHGISWEINEKKFDKEEQKEKNLSQAVIRIDLKKPYQTEVEFPFFFLDIEAKIDSIAFTASKEDVIQIADALNEVKRKMLDLDKEVK